ncbi:MAG: quinone-dependent dihydroorotate dehydrogenase [Anaplasmataceae bacterium]|nr:quinone-dependent dihydroorotate dehydrogenase [Anaplasmataceae bacterium]
MKQNYKTPLLNKLGFLLSPEVAHDSYINAMKFNCIKPANEYKHQSLENNLLDRKFINPIGLAAGFDKNAAVISHLIKEPFSFLEFGTVTPKKQYGNPKPRLFRLEKDFSLINRMGFCNDGINKFIHNISKQKEKNQKNIGINIGANKDTENYIDDYIKLLPMVANYCDYVTINISSPNTQNLRDLEKIELLNNLLNKITEIRDRLHNAPKIMVKLSPDIENNQYKDITKLLISYKIDGIIISNTTTTRPKTILNKQYKCEVGGLSGAKLFELSNKALRYIYGASEGKIPIIGCGGIMSGQDAFEKIKLGASLVQIYTAIVYYGMDVVNKINQELVDLLAKNGFTTIKDAIGYNV